VPAVTVRGDGLDLRVLDDGDGPPVLLCHGFPDRAELWRDVAARLRDAGRRTLVPDMRGFGESGIPARTRDVRTSTVHRDLLAILAARGVEGPVDLVGHDWGAYITWTFCADHAARVRRHVAISTGHPSAFVLAGPSQWRRSRYMLEWQLPGITERRLRADGFARLRAAAPHPDMDQALADLSRPGRLTAGLRWYRGLLREPRPPARCPVPTLGLVPTQDVFLGERQMRLSGRFCDAAFEVRRIEGAGHWVQRERPDEVAAAILDWLA
jgi:pimeloyl-ACP methyl ester carboxylesterase